MSVSITIQPKTPRTLHISKMKKCAVIDIDIWLSELSIDDRIKIASWALQNLLIK